MNQKCGINCLYDLNRVVTTPDCTMNDGYIENKKVSYLQITSIRYTKDERVKSFLLFNEW